MNRDGKGKHLRAQNKRLKVKRFGTGQGKIGRTKALIPASFLSRQTEKKQDLTPSNHLYDNKTTMIRFFNTLGGKVELFKPLTPGEVKLYTCGPTVYDFAHIGNYRAYIFEDLLKRFLTASGCKVFHVMNITDVDDKTIKGANSQGLSLQDFTRKYTEAFFEDLRTLNIQPADVFPRATEHITEMAAMVKGLLEKGFAYEKDGSTYFAIDKFPNYGRLSKIDLAELQPGQRGEADEYDKESVHDFALWKKNKEGEPFWDTELGPGRPGWHIECSAMSIKYLGPTFDIHCGGVDNIFPHHENEIAQSEAFTGRKFVNTWLHCHHLVVNGEKMSKSKGNFYTLRDLLQRGIDPLDLRFLLLGTHYRKTLNFTFEALEQSAAARRRVRDFVYELEHRPLAAGSLGLGKAVTEEAAAKFLDGLGDDLNIATAMTALFELIRAGHSGLAEGRVGKDDADRLMACLQTMDGVLGVLPPRREITLEERVLKRIEEREQARRAKDFNLADAIRAELLAAGVVLEDTRDGVRWKLVRPDG
jgi:cysteinyl-tRNA synthetase